MAPSLAFGDKKVVTIPALIWFILGVVCFLLEMMVPGFIVFFFGVGAWITAIVCWFTPLGINSQLGVFLAGSLLSLLALRGLVRRTFIGGSSHGEETSSVAQPGETAEVAETITPPFEGKVSYSGTLWRATAEEEIVKGEVVTIISQDGLVMRVKKNPS